MTLTEVKGRVLYIGSQKLQAQGLASIKHPVINNENPVSIEEASTFLTGLQLLVHLPDLFMKLSLFASFLFICIQS